MRSTIPTTRKITSILASRITAMRFADRALRYAAQTILAPILQNQRDGLRETFAALFDGPPLHVRSGDFRAIGDIPFAILLDDRGEFIAHVCLHPNHTDFSTSAYLPY